MLFIMFSYLLGTLLAAAMVSKIMGVDLQNANSGNLGARNAGRTIGKWAFVVVAVLDGLKGLLVVIGGRLLELPEQTIAFAVVAVILGHLYPFWNKGIGGKGVATIVGAMIAFSPLYLLLFLAIFLVSLLFTKSATLSMVVGFIFYGTVISLMLEAGLIVSVALAIVLWKQRKSIVERVKPNVLE